MASFEIEGGRPLSGEIIPQGAKNEALQVICAVLLTSEPVTIHNVPKILDVLRLIDILSIIGVKVTAHSDNSYTFDAKDVNIDLPMTLLTIPPPNLTGINFSGFFMYKIPSP